MTPVERAREICKSKGIPVSQLERDLGYGNGYLNPKKASEILSDRAVDMARYLGVSVDYLLTGNESEQEKTPATDGDRRELTEDQARLIKLISRLTPEETSELLRQVTAKILDL